MSIPTASTQHPLCARIRATARAFAAPGQHVTVNADRLAEVADGMRGTRFAPVAPGGEVALFGCLLLNAVNYCYWLGRSDYYPAGHGASGLTQVIGRLLAGVESLTSEAVIHAGDAFCRHVALSGLPLTDRRIAHIREVTSRPAETILFIEAITENRLSVGSALEELVALYPGFAADAFLKRAVLFLHLANRCHGYFRAEELAELPIAADYQLPKMLASHGAFEYSSALRDMIARDELIASGSKLELEIRGATILACDRIASLSGLTPGQVDDCLWSARDSVAEPFHLTITTDY